MAIHIAAPQHYNPLVWRTLRLLVVTVALSFIATWTYCQDEVVTDSIQPLVKTESIVDSVKQDSLDRHTEISPLDIGRNRGLFILSSDKLMQMRILGSVRALFTFSNKELEDKNALNPFELPTGDVGNQTNFYAGLQQTRLGFEVTRRTRQVGDIFLRIEADFANQSNGFRIRHAYGQINNILVGQTWSLFSNVQYLPATVDLNGPAGSIGLRTPQVRYYRSISERLSWYAAMEYSSPRINSPDSLGVDLIQVIPDLTGRLDYVFENLSFQLNFLLNTLSGRDKSIPDSKIKSKLGYGFSLSLKYDLKPVGTIYLSGTTGRAIAHYIDVFAGKAMDLTFDAANSKFEELPVHTAYLGYGRQLPAKFSTNTAFGFASIDNYEFQETGELDYLFNFLLNVFWQPVDGARLGIEYNYARRADWGGDKGRGSRVSILLYYDF